jgi:broad-specificity NMP kinase
MIITITGGPGTGKTTLCKELKKRFGKDLIICGTTNIAAAMYETGKLLLIILDNLLKKMKMANLILIVVLM